MSESDEPIYGAKNLTLDQAKATLVRREKTISLHFSNADPKIIQDLKLDAKIYKKGSSEVLRKALLENGRMAPNSNFTFEVPWGLAEMKPGTYVAKVTASSNTDKWTFEKEFTVTDDQAKKINQDTITKLTLPMWLHIVFLLIVVVLCVLWVYSNKRRKKWQMLLVEKKKKGV